MHKNEKNIWIADSAFEAWAIGRAAAATANDGTQYFIIKHSSEEDQLSPHDELAYFERVQKFGELAVPQGIFAKAKDGFLAISKNEKQYGGITPEIARLAISIMVQNGEVFSDSIELPMQPPDFSTLDIAVTVNKRPNKIPS
ncbi:MAG: hypothetical protein QFB86_03645 [Patescibacteria group bacterium]|nr:hypothetical protein [Patescibacteria group bacterium]